MQRRRAPFWRSSIPADRRRLSHLAAVVSLLLLPTVAAAPTGFESPLAFRDRLVKQFLAGRSVATEVEDFRARTGDHSLDSLEEYSAQKAETLRLAFVTATDAWLVAEDLDEALRLFSRAHQAFVAEQAWSEAGFCLYYMAEILSQKELYREALEIAERAAPYGRDSPFLGGLLCESQGYSLWYLDRLQSSALAFSQAGRFWSRLGCPLGIAGAWNNMAALYEEMGLWDRAAACYLQALRLEPEITRDLETRFYLHANYASFLAKQGRTEDALEQLRAAESFQHVSPGEFLLLRSRLLGVDKQFATLEHFRSDSPSLRIEKALLLGEFYSTRDQAKALEHLDQAIELSSRMGLRHYRRAACLALGRLLESESRHAEAARHYLDSFKKEENLRSPELLFPYSQTVSPLFDGWVRSLVRAGRQREALIGIRKLVELRRLKAQSLRVVGAPATAQAFDRFSHAARAEPPPTPGLDWDAISIDPTPAGAAAIGPATLVELWPDRDEVYAWVTRRADTAFHSLRLSRPIAESLDSALSSLYSPGPYLPPAPPSAHLERLYRELFRPIEKEIDSPTVIVVAHKDLQILPLEMLRDDRGHYLLETYSFVYLPRVFAPDSRTAPRSAPAAVLPASRPILPSVEQEELFFRTTLPDVRIYRRVDPAQLDAPAWLHISAHLRLDTDFWISSGLQDEAGGASVLSLLDCTRSCSIVSLGVCHAANAYSLHSPYWLGFSELFLARGAGALLVSRWALDDFSARIYRDFYLAAREGIPMDEAFTMARRRFLGLRLTRDGVSASGSHPYFWAGLAYVGYPGQRLYEPAPPMGGLTAMALAFPPLAVVALGLARLRFRRDRAPSEDRRGVITEPAPATPAPEDPR
jgi:tetratricopeptide (TPR) repeat protein